MYTYLFIISFSSDCVYLSLFQLSVPVVLLSILHHRLTTLGGGGLEIKLGDRGQVRRDGGQVRRDRGQVRRDRGQVRREYKLPGQDICMCCIQYMCEHILHILNPNIKPSTEGGGTGCK